MSFYVRRINIGTGREGWIGPIHNEKRALREAAAWESETDSFGNHWSADVFRSCAEVRQRVRAWQTQVRA